MAGMKWIWMLVLLIGGCAAGAQHAQVTLSRDKRELRLAGEVFHPWGFNYDRDYKNRLIEEYWDLEWGTVEKDFREMKALGANTVRVHLQVAAMMDGPEKGNVTNLRRLGDLLKLAEEVGLKLDLTGLANYRKAESPAWYTHGDEAEHWRVQANFWRIVAKQCAGSPAVLCYDLINEPLVPWSPRKEGDYFVGDLGGFTYCQFITLDARGRKRDEVAKAWVEQMKGAIREVDKTHLITVGMLPNSVSLAAGQSGFLPATVGPELDLICTHIYPRKGKEMDEDIKTLGVFAAVGKPVVIEETFSLNCGSAELRRFLTRAKPLAAGALGFFWGEGPGDLDAKNSIRDAILLDWFKVFAQGW